MRNDCVDQVLEAHKCAVCGEGFDDYPEYGMADRDIPELGISKGDRFHEGCLEDLLGDLRRDFKRASEDYWEV